MGAAEIEAFLTHLAVEKSVTACTQNQAPNALLFLYRMVLKKDLDGFIDAARAKRPTRLPTVLTQNEIRCVLAYLNGEQLLMAQLDKGCWAVFYLLTPFT